ncbi:MAG TPA: CpaF family protein [Acidimicrobiales bacterium]|nr:CpaF family protein [Acidimicrobiales bacterium]
MTRELADRVRARLVADIEPTAVVDPGLIAQLVREEAPLIDRESADAAVADVLADVRGLGVLESVLQDEAITEVMVNGPGAVWVERAGRLERLALTIDRSALEHIVERVVGPLGLRVDRSSPAVDARLPDGSRVHVIVPPLAIDGPYVTIRRFAAASIPLEQFTGPAVCELLRRAIAARLNVIVCGGTGSGKTTLLNALVAHVATGERIVTIEDAAELRLPQEHVVRLEARPANAEGVGKVSIRELVRNALRMRPDRIVVGECRGPEALDMLQAMNTGHDGSLSTCHANSPLDALRRLETMVLLAGEGLPLVAVREHVHAAVDLVVEVSRAPGGRRLITAVTEVAPDSEADRRVRLLADASGVVGEPSRGAR